MNKTQAFMLIVLLAVLGIGGAVVLLILAPESADKFITLLVTLLVTLGGFAGLTAQQAKTAERQAEQAETIDLIKKNTNGTLTELREENAQLRSIAAQHAPRALRRLEAAPVDTVQE